MKEPHTEVTALCQEIKKNRKPNGRRAAMDMEKVQAVFLCHKIKNQTEK